MTTLLKKVADQYQGDITQADVVEFNVDGSDFAIVDGTLYAKAGDMLLPGCKKVKTLRAVERFVALRA